MADNIFDGLADAIKDIREKVVEEPMWGRSLSDDAAAPRWPEAQQAAPEQAQQEVAQAPEPEQQQQPEPDLDR
jgi:hypothetical protein